MKSSLLGMMSWTHSQRSSFKPDLNQNSSGLTRSSVDSDKNKMDVSVCLGKANHNHSQFNSHQSPQKRQQGQRRMPPLLRLDSEGEISTGKNFCDKAVNNQFDKINNQLRLSNSFDSYNYNMAAKTKSHPTTNISPSAGRSFESSLTYKNIPSHHQSFKKSLSFPGLPTHQSYPPPASAPSSAITHNFSCPVGDRISPFSSGPRVLGFVNIFGKNSHMKMERNSESNSTCGCALSSSPFADKCLVPSQMDVNVREKNVCKNVEKTRDSKSNIVNGGESSCDSQNIASEANNSSKFDESSQSSSRSFICSDNSSVLFIRKKKRKRSRNRHRRKKEVKQEPNVNATSFRPSSCSSPLRDNSTVNTSEESNSHRSTTAKACSSSTGVLNVKIVSPIRHCVSKAKSNSELASSPVDKARSPPRNCQVDIVQSLDDDDDEDDLVFEIDDSSVKFVENSSLSSSKSNSKVSSKKRKCKSGNDIKFEASDDSEGECCKTSSSGLHFTLSMTVSEDEDNDSSVDWDLSGTSPLENNHFMFEFEFNTGLSLDTIIGTAETADCPEARAIKKKLQELNKKWNEMYASESLLSQSSPRQQRVHFAGEEDLAIIHLVGDEDRAGDWQRYALERERFQKRCNEVENVLAPVFCESHRARIFDSLNSSAE